jgi:hypothetical protein
LMVPFHLGLVALCGRRPLVAVVAACLALVLAFTLDSRAVAWEIAESIVSSPAVWGLAFLAAVWLCIAPLRRRLAALVALFSERVHRWRSRLAAQPVRLRVRAVMKAAIVYFNSAVWIGCIVGRSSMPETQYLMPLVCPVVFLAVDSTESLSRRALIILSVIGVAALVCFPFAPIASELGNVIGLVLSAFTALAVVARLIRWRGLVLGRDPFAAPSSTLAFVFAVLVMVISLPDMILVPRERQVWPVGAAEELANGLYKSGFTFPQLMASIQGQSAGPIQSMIAILDPNLFADPGPVRETGWSLLPLMVEPAEVARTEGVVLTFAVSRSRSAIVVRAPSYLDRTHVRTCYATECGGEPLAGSCAERQPDQPLRRRPPYFQVDRDALPVPGKAFGNAAAGRRDCTWSSIPLHTSGSGVTHIVRVLDEWPWHLRIRRVSGADFEGPLPGAEVRLVDTRESTGTLEIEASCDRRVPGLDCWLEDPPLIEVTAANEHLLEPFRRGRTSLR